MNEPTPSALEWARNKLKDAPDPMPTKVLSDAMGYKTNTAVVRAIQKQELPRIRLGNGYKIDKADAIRFLAERRSEVTEENQ